MIRQQLRRGDPRARSRAPDARGHIGGENSMQRGLRPLHNAGCWTRSHFEPGSELDLTVDVPFRRPARRRGHRLQGPDRHEAHPPGRRDRRGGGTRRSSSMRERGCQALTAIDEGRDPGRRLDDHRQDANSCSCRKRRQGQEARGGGALRARSARRSQIPALNEAARGP